MGGWFAMAQAPRSGGRVGETTTSRKPAAPSQALGRLRHDSRHLVAHLGDPEVHHDGRRHAGQVVRAEARLPSLDTGQAQRVPRVEAVAGVEVARRVAHRAGEAAEHGRHRLDGAVRPLGDPAVGRLQPEQAAEARRAPDRSAPVAPRGDRQQATGHGGRGATGRAARRALMVPGVARRPVELGRGAVDAAELGCGRLRGEDGPRRPQSGHRRVVVAGHPVLEDDRRLRVGPPLHLLELLDPEGHAAEGQRHVGPTRRLAGTLEVGVGESIER